LELVQGIQTESDCFWALNKLIPQLPDHLLLRALEVAQGLKFESYRARILNKLVPRLSGELLNTALTMAREFRDCYHRAAVFQSLASKLSLISTDIDPLCEMLLVLSHLGRQELILGFSNLAGYIVQKFGKSALEEMVESMREVSYQWK
jgi:hypothetical protein